MKAPAPAALAHVADRGSKSCPEARDFWARAEAARDFEVDWRTRDEARIKAEARARRRAIEAMHVARGKTAKALRRNAAGEATHAANHKRPTLCECGRSVDMRETTLLRCPCGIVHRKVS